ncbi:6-pyruvoyl-tetrahydropterin synthase-related protein [Silvibacterium sp.]|uniref:6-pyruvoyl-tetrahydropterin synthase-related protein n=1 Tax=Silvibacterium sp. TaxID=1964179 RepID=UPI0039E2A97F
MKLDFSACQLTAGRAARSRRSLFLACAGIAVLPLAWHGVSCGHDFDFHLESWIETVHHWREGVAYPHWAASPNYGAGEPRFVFYPPLSWALGALLGAVLPWTWVPLAFTLIALVAMGVACFRMAREWMTEGGATLAACLYILNPYTLFVAYERTAYGELLAAASIPLVLLYALRRKAAVPELSLAIAALWLTNAPGAVMGCYAMALLVGWMAITERRWGLIGRAAGGSALGLGLASFYLLPALVEQRWVEISRAIGDGMRVEDSFLFGHTGEPFHDQVLRTASWIAVTLLAATIATAVAAHRGRQQPKLRSGLLLLAAVIAVLLLPFSDPTWRHVPELQFLQFPWRWLLVLGLVLSLLAGFGIRQQARTRRSLTLRVGAMLLFALLMAAFSWTRYWQPCDDEDNVRAQLATFAAQGFEGTDEYTATAADNGDIQQNLPEVRILPEATSDTADSSIAENPEWHPVAPSLAGSVRIHRWQSEHKSVVVDSPAPAFAVLRLMDYPAWNVVLNGRPITERPRRDDGLMVIPIPAGRSEIEVRYGLTKDMWGGRSLSLISLVLLMGAVLLRIQAARNSEQVK